MEVSARLKMLCGEIDVMGMTIYLGNNTGISRVCEFDNSLVEASICP